MLDNLAALYLAALREEPPIAAARDALSVWLRDVFTSRRTFMVEIPLAVFAVVMGAWLLFTAGAPLDRPGAYVWTGQLEPVWGYVIMANGLHYCVGLVAAGLRRRWAVRHCLFACAVSCAIWGSFFLDLTANSSFTWGPPLFALPWGLSVGCLWRLIIVARGKRRWVEEA